MSPQGKRPKPVAAPRDNRAGHRRLAIVVLSVLLVGAFVWVAAAQGLGDPDVPEGAIAVVEEAPDGEISQEEFDDALQRAAIGQGLREVPAEDDPQYEPLKDTAVNDVILARWFAGEAEERGIEIEDRAVEEQLEVVLEQEFGGDQKAFDQFLEESNYTDETARERIRLGLIRDRLQESAVPADAEGDITDDQIEDYYDENTEQFEQPESRDIRVILTRDEADAQEALDALGTDPGAKTWDEVAKEFSTDEATKNSGGLRQGVLEGQSEPALDEAVFSAGEGELIGPIEAEAGFYVFEVEGITDASTTPIEEAEEQIRQTLAAAAQQGALEEFTVAFQEKWTARTFCAEGYRIERCANADPLPDPCTEELADSTGCDAPVPPRTVFEPGTAPSLGGIPPTLLPQGPCAWLDPEEESLVGRSCEAWPLKPAPEGAGAPAGLPPGLSIPPGGAPQGAVPPGAAPQGAVPPGAVPQGAVPQGAVPQGAVPQGAVPPGG